MRNLAQPHPALPVSVDQLEHKEVYFLLNSYTLNAIAVREPWLRSPVLLPWEIPMVLALGSC